MAGDLALAAGSPGEDLRQMAEEGVRDQGGVIALVHHPEVPMPSRVPLLDRRS